MNLIKNKFTLIAGTLLLTLSLTACGSGSGNEPTDDPNTELNTREVENGGRGSAEFSGDEDGEFEIDVRVNDGESTEDED